MKGGIEGAFLDEQDAVGAIADEARDGVSVQRTAGEGLENEDVERPLQQLEIGQGGTSP